MILYLRWNVQQVSIVLSQLAPSKPQTFIFPHVPENTCDTSVFECIRKPFLPPRNASNTDLHALKTVLQIIHLSDFNSTGTIDIKIFHRNNCNDNCGYFLMRPIGEIWCHAEIIVYQYWELLAVCSCEFTASSTVKLKPSNIKARQHLLWSRKQNICVRIAFDLRAWDVFQTEAICHESKKMTLGKQSVDYFWLKS